jgi:cathepsin L
MRDTNNFFVGDEYKFRFGIFVANQRRVKEFNRKSSYRVAMNKFSTLTETEYKTMLGHRQSAKIDGQATVSNVKAPASFDWREKGVVNEVKDQAQCGSCWAFSVVQAQESQWAIKKNKLYSLSEQNLVDCVTYCYGCNGGDEYIAYDYVIKYQDGLWMTEDDYPYTAQDGSCKFDKSKGVAPTKSYIRPTTTQNEDELAAGLAEKGVVSIAIDASGWDFQMYSSGIYNPSSCSSRNLDHAVGLVGYGTENSVDYWIVRNSWGTSWGEDGYIRIIRNNNNKCGVASDVIIPHV